MNETAKLELTQPPKTRIQRKNHALILEAALEVFSTHGFRGATVDQIAAQAGLSKPNLLYYFATKETIHVALLSRLMENWLAPLEALNADGAPIEELLGYMHRKLEMSRDYPRESRLFANEILQGAPRILPSLETDLRNLVDAKCLLIQRWMDAGQLAPSDPYHLIFSIWSLTQHYADFGVQVGAVLGTGAVDFEQAHQHLTLHFTRMLTP